MTSEENRGWIPTEILDGSDSAIDLVVHTVIHVEHVPCAAVLHFGHDMSVEPPRARLETGVASQYDEIARGVVAEAVPVHVNELDWVMSIIIGAIGEWIRGKKMV